MRRHSRWRIRRHDFFRHFHRSTADEVAIFAWLYLAAAESTSAAYTLFLRRRRAIAASRRDYRRTPRQLAHQRERRAFHHDSCLAYMRNRIAASSSVAPRRAPVVHIIMPDRCFTYKILASFRHVAMRYGHRADAVLALAFHRLPPFASIR